MTSERRRLLVLDLQRATHAVGLRIEAELDDLGISQGEAHVLALLHGAEPHTVGELQRGLHHRASTLSGILDRLESRRLLRRTLNPDDRRSLLVSLTAPGRRAAARVVSALERIERDAATAVRPADLSGFRAVAHALAQPPE